MWQVFLPNLLIDPTQVLSCTTVLPKGALPLALSLPETCVARKLGLAIHLEFSQLSQALCLNRCASAMDGKYSQAFFNCQHLNNDRDNSY